MRELTGRAPRTSNGGRRPTGHRRRLRTATVAAAVLGVTGLALAGCGSSGASNAAGGGDGAKVTIEISDGGCEPKPASIAAGPVEFDVSNNDSAKVTEAELISGSRTLGEQENLTPGLSGSFGLELSSGKYRIYCPGAQKDSWDFTVTGEGAAASWTADPAQVKATQDWGTYVTRQTGQLVTATQAFAAAVEAGDVPTAKIRYAQARVFYERIEPVAESWGTLDASIDGRIDDAPDPAHFTGFHRIEQALWVDNTTTGMAPLAQQLVTNVQQLQQLAANAGYQPAQIANGATDLINEVTTSKVTGEEERYSHLDLVDFRGNVDGAKEAFTALQPALQAKKPDLVKTIQDRFAAVDASLVAYAQSPGYEDSGYVDYSTVPDTARQQLAAPANALAEALSQVAAALA